MSWVISAKHRYGKDKIWVATSKASQYYKAYAKIVRLHKFTKINIKWNPLNEHAFHARTFQNVISNPNISEPADCKVEWEEHEEDEPPIFTFHVRDKTNTRVVFDASQIDFDDIVKEANFWGDHTRASIPGSTWNKEGIYALAENDFIREKETRDNALNHAKVAALLRTKRRGLFAFEKRITIEEFADPTASHWHTELPEEVLFDPGFVPGEEDRDEKPLFEFPYTVFDDNGPVWPPPELHKEAMDIEQKFQAWRKKQIEPRARRRRPKTRYQPPDEEVELIPKGLDQKEAQATG